MKRNIIKSLAIIAMGTVLLTAFQCGKEEPIELNYNAHHSDCLFHTDAAAVTAKGHENPDSVSIAYSGGTLHVTHHNLLVNCGTAEMEGGIDVTVIREGSTIDIYEEENENNPQANCMCEVDNEFDITGISHGTYTLVFHSWYPNPESLTFTF